MANIVIGYTAAAWFYVLGKRNKQNPSLWALVAIPAYYIPQFIVHRLIFVLARTDMLQIRDGESFNFKFNFVLIAIGLICAYAVYRYIVRKRFSCLEPDVPFLLPAILVTAMGSGVVGELLGSRWLWLDIILGLSLLFFLFFAVNQGIRLRKPLFCSLVTAGVLFVSCAPYLLFFRDIWEALFNIPLCLVVGFFFSGLSAWIAKKKYK